MTNMREARAAHMRTLHDAYLQTALDVVALAMGRSWLALLLQDTLERLKQARSLLCGRRGAASYGKGCSSGQSRQRRRPGATS
jgi:hypothetical protein